MNIFVERPEKPVKNTPMKKLLLTIAIAIAAVAVQAGGKDCPSNKNAAACPASKTASADKNNAACCDKSKASCAKKSLSSPKAADTQR